MALENAGPEEDPHRPSRDPEDLRRVDPPGRRRRPVVGAAGGDMHVDGKIEVLTGVPELLVGRMVPERAELVGRERQWWEKKPAEQPHLSGGGQVGYGRIDVVQLHDRHSGVAFGASGDEISQPSVVGEGAGAAQPERLRVAVGADVM